MARLSSRRKARGVGKMRDRPGRGPRLPRCVPFRDVRLGGDGGHERDRGCRRDSREREGRQRARKVRSSQRWVGNNSDGQVSENRASAERHRLICAADLTSENSVKRKFTRMVHRRSPTAQPRNSSGSCTVTSRNPLIHNGATTATKSERFDAEGIPPCCCRVLGAMPDTSFATVNF